MSEVIPASQSIQEQLDALYEKELMRVCDSKAQLKQWIKTFLGIDMPDKTIDPNSNSNPMEFIWDVYSAARDGDPTRTTFVVAAGRNTMKCLAKGTLVATPNGPKEIENIKIGDTVYDQYGKEIKVIGHWDQGVQPVVNIYSSDMKLIASATEKHIWSARHENEFEFKNVTTASLANGFYLKIVNTDTGEVSESKILGTESIGDAQCYDLTVDSPESLYCLANGAVTHNTLSASIIEFLMMLHFGRDIVHQAAILDQSLACIGYLDKFLGLPAVRKYSNIDNKREKQLRDLPITALRPSAFSKLKVIVASRKSANAQRASCLSGDTKVLKYTEGGKRVDVQIENLVKNFSAGIQQTVLSINPVNGVLEYKPVIAALKKKDTLYSIELENGNKIKATRDHKFCNDKKGSLENSKKVEELKPGDVLYTLSSAIENVPEWNDAFSLDEIITGSLLGDGCVYKRKFKPNGEPYFGNALFSMNKTETVESYLEWLTIRFSDITRTGLKKNRKSGYTGLRNLTKIVSGQHKVWTEYHDKWYAQGKKQIPSDLQLNLRTLAIWMMDDGSNGLRKIYSAGFSDTENLILCDKINALFNAEVAHFEKYFVKSRNKFFGHIALDISKISFKDMNELVSYIHPAYRYKLKDSRFFFLKEEKIKEIKEIGEDWVYDIEVADNHNFFANNISSRNCLLFDELDLIEKDILSESTFIADPDKAGRPPIFIYLSSRKSASGPIQEKIDMSDDPQSFIKLHKWSTVDFMKTCPPSVHRPDEPRVNMYVHKETLLVRQEDTYSTLPQTMKSAYDEVHAYAGCVKCPAFVVCQARAPKQDGTSPSLRDIPFVATTIRNAADPDKINAQLLNLKPESGGTVFNKFSKHIHRKPMNEVWEFAFGKPPEKFVTKHDLVKELRSNGWRINCGVDFGWVDPNTAVLMAYQKSSEKILIIHCEASPGFSPEDWLFYVKTKIYNEYGFDLLCPDVSSGEAVSKAAKLNLPTRSTKPSKIETGVGWLRARIWNASRQESQFMVLEDPSNDLLVKSLESWQYLRTSMGFDTSQFADDEWTHMIDALRYGVDPFIIQQPSVVSVSQIDNKTQPANMARVDSVESMQEAIKRHFLGEFGIEIQEPKKEENKENLNSGNIVISF